MAKLLIGQVLVLLLLSLPQPAQAHPRIFVRLLRVLPEKRMVWVESCGRKICVQFTPRALFYYDKKASSLTQFKVNDRVLVDVLSWECKGVITGGAMCDLRSTTVNIEFPKQRLPTLPVRITPSIDEYAPDDNVYPFKR